METITFTSLSDAGADLGNISVTGIVTYDTDFHDVSLNQSIVITADGGSVAQGNSIKRAIGRILINGVLKAEGSAFKTWLRDTLDIQGHYVGIGLNGASIELGKGFGTDILFVDRARYRYATTDRAAKLKTPGDFDLVFDYTFKRA